MARPISGLTSDDAALRKDKEGDRFKSCSGLGVCVIVEGESEKLVESATASGLVVLS